MSKSLVYAIFLFSILQFISCNQKSSSMTQKQGDHKYTNSLINETSPYLLQHAHNPVNWHAWNDETLAKAQKEDKLIIVSIGYAACHWCHVMEHESFEDSLVAAIMNEHFIPIKVDREERPDVDDVYMTACNLINGRGGWPLNAFALPDGSPIWAGTYFPQDQWIKILEQFRDLKETDYDKLKESANELTQGVRAQGDIVKVDKKVSFDQNTLSQFNKNIFKVSDYKDGGRSGSPKFPMPSIYDYLLEQYRITQDPKLIETVNITLSKMADGGIYDQLGGGFARYSVDQFWLVPHFEKMLYDNGQLVSVYSKAFQATKDKKFLHIVDETLEFISRELTDNNGVFYSSLDADSEGEEGKFYVWTAEELEQLLEPDEYKVFAAYYSVEKNGNWEETNILHRSRDLGRIALDLKMDKSDILKVIDLSKAKLMKVRSRRVRPGLDDKIITAWNGLMITGFVDAYKATANEAYKKSAIRAADFILEKQFDRGQLKRNFKDGKSTINAFLDDYALLIQALIDIYEITFEYHYLEKAELLTEHAIDHFSNEESGMFFYTSDLDPPLVARRMELNDNVIPGSNSTMARALHELGTLLYKPEYVDRAVQMASNMYQSLKDSDRSDFSSGWNILFNDLVNTPYEIAIVGPDAAKLRNEMMTHFLPDALYLGGIDEGQMKMLEGKLQGDDTFIYVCQNRVCKFPVRDVESAIDLMNR